MSSDPELRLPPFNREAEQSVLGSMLRDNKIIDDVALILSSEEYFYTDAHRKIYRGILELHTNSQPVDVVTLAEWLNQQKFVEDIGGYVYLKTLLEAAPSAANAEYYARIVRDKGILRSLIHAGSEIARDAYDQSEGAEELLGSAERKILQIAQMGSQGASVTLKVAIEEAFHRLDARVKKTDLTLAGVPSGYIDLDERTGGFQSSELIVLAARPSVGKCLAHDAEIVLADGGIATIEELYRLQRAQLLTLKNNYRFTWTTPSAYIDDGIKPVYQVTTRLGRRVDATLSHPFLTLNGWQSLGTLRLGDQIAVPRRLDVFGTTALPECRVKLLAYLIGDGGLSEGTPDFTNSNERLRTEFQQAVTEFGGLRTRLEDSNGTRTPTLHVSSDREGIRQNRLEFGARLRQTLATQGLSARRVAQRLRISPASLTHWQQGVCAPDQITVQRLCQVLAVDPENLMPQGPAALSKNGKNPLTRWLEELGLWGQTAQGKFVPACIFQLPRQQLALFLNRLFATDGWATVLASGAPQLGYATVSERLARQVQHLLLRFGIIAALRQRRVNYREGRTAWQLDVTDQDSLQTFLSEIGIFGKEEACQRVHAALQGRRHQTNVDLIPVVIWAQIAAAKGSESWHSLGLRLGLGEGANLHVGARQFSRHRLGQFAELLQDERLQQLAESDVYWDRIEAIDYLGDKQVYDLTIPETHNFIANDICVHNTAFALNVVRHVTVDAQLPVFFVSLEMSRLELAERLLICQARVEGHKLRKGTIDGDDSMRLMDAGEVLNRAKLFIDDAPGQTMLRIAANSRRLQRSHNIALVVIDYLQLIEPENRRDSRQEQVGAISRRLKILAKELKIPVIALAQVNRSAEDRQDHRPRVSDLRESGSIEQDADSVLILHRPEIHEPGQHEGVVELIIGKQRNGPTGEITLTYLKQFMRFENFAVEPPFSYGN